MFCIDTQKNKLTLDDENLQEDDVPIQVEKTYEDKMFSYDQLIRRKVCPQLFSSYLTMAGVSAILWYSI